MPTSPDYWPMASTCRLAGLAIALTAGLAPASLCAQQRSYTPTYGPVPQRQAQQRPRQFRFDENVEIAQVGAQEELRGPQEQIQPQDQLQDQLQQQDMPLSPRNTEIQCFSVTPDKLQEVADELRLRYKNRRDVSIN